MKGPMVNPRASSLQFRQKIQQAIIGLEGRETGTAAITDSACQADFIQKPLHRAEALIQISGLNGSCCHSRNEQQSTQNQATRPHGMADRRNAAIL